MRRGRFSLDVLAKVALGFIESSVTAVGSNTTGAATNAGGLLVQPGTNIGYRDRAEPNAIPEIGVKLGYQVRNNIRAYVGYSFLYWYHVVRAGDQVDLGVDPSFVGLGAGVGNPVRPAQRFQDTDIWVQGITLGFEWRY
jgi:hypothetical protein